MENFKLCNYPKSYCSNTWDGTIKVLKVAAIPLPQSLTDFQLQKWDRQ